MIISRAKKSRGVTYYLKSPILLDSGHLDQSYGGCIKIIGIYV